MWLARELSMQGKVLNPGDIVATGSCTPILQVLPGQELSVDFGSLGEVASSTRSRIHGCRRTSGCWRKYTRRTMG